MSDNWYFVSFNFKTTEEPPTDAWELIQWLRQVQPIAYDNIRLVNPGDSDTIRNKTLFGNTDG